MISIIVVNYNGKKFLKNCLESLYNVNYQNKEIIVIDNGSRDRSFSFLYEEFITSKKIIFAGYQFNQGLAIASNYGASLAKGDYLFFLNNDTIVDKNIFNELLKSNTDVTGSKMYDYTGAKELDSALSVDRFGYPCGRTGQIFYPDGAIFIKKEMFERIGGFDEELFLYGEDRDLCWRVLLAGGTISYCPSAIFYHASRCVNNTNFSRRKIAERNIIRSMLKNYTLKSLLFILPQYLFWSILELGLLLVVNPKAIYKSYLPAYWWNVVNFRNTWQEHRKVQKIRKVSDRYIRSKMSKQIGKLFVLRTIGIPKFKCAV